MPELPEVETVCRGLNQLTCGQVIVDGEVLLERTIAHPFSAQEFLAGVKGCCIVQWQRRGKYLLAELKGGSEGSWLGVHLRMTGQLLALPQDTPLQKHTRVRLFFAEGQELRFVDQRTFGKIWWVPPKIDPTTIISGLARLGPEPLAEDFTLEYFTQRLQRINRSIKTTLLDQSVVAGVGNIYADECLFLARINPNQVCKDLSVAEIKEIRASLIQVLQQAIECGGSTIRNYVSVKGVNGNYMGQAWVYNRQSQPCRVCQTPITKIRLAGRSAHFCSQCQPAHQ